MTDRQPLISVMLAVPNAQRAAYWYCRALGAEELWNLGSVVGLTIGGAPLFVGEPENNGWDVGGGIVRAASQIRSVTCGSWGIARR